VEIEEAKKEGTNQANRSENEPFHLVLLGDAAGEALRPEDMSSPADEAVQGVPQRPRHGLEHRRRGGERGVHPRHDVHDRAGLRVEVPVLVQDGDTAQALLVLPEGVQQRKTHLALDRLVR